MTFCFEKQKPIMLAIIACVMVLLLSAFVHPYLANADDAGLEFSVGNAKEDGSYYYKVIDDTSASLMAVDVRSAESFNGTIVVPDKVVDADTGKSYDVAEIRADLPDALALPLQEGGAQKATHPNMNIIVTTRNYIGSDTSRQNYNKDCVFMAGWHYDADTSWDDENAAKVKSVIIGKNVKTLGHSAFQYLPNLKNVSFKQGSLLEDIGTDVFKENTSISGKISYALDSIGIEGELEPGTFDFSGFGHLKSIDTSFSGCGAKKLVISASCEKAAYINGLSLLEELVIPENSELTDMPAFGNSQSSATRANSMLKTVSVGAGSKMTQIPQYAFAFCTALRSVDIPDSIESIGNSAFRGSGIESVELSDNVKTLGTFVFGLCENLKLVVFGKSIGTINNNDTRDCSNLSNVVIGADKIDVTFNANNLKYQSASNTPVDELNLFFTGSPTAVSDPGNVFANTQTLFLAKNLKIYTDSDVVKAFFSDAEKCAPKTTDGTTAGAVDVKVTVMPLPDKTALNAALEAAPAQVDAAKAKYAVAESAADVVTGTQFVTQDAIDALDAAIAAAQVVADDPTATAEQIEAAAASIPAAIAAFEGSAAAGTNDAMAVDDVVAALPAAPATDASAEDAAAYKAAVENALKAYDALSDEGKAAVSELPALLAAQRAVAARDAADAAAAATKAASDLEAAKKEAEESAAKVTQLEQDLATAQATATQAKEAAEAAKQAASKQVVLAKPVLTNKTKSVKKGKVTATWKKVAGATGYELKVGSKTYTVKKATTLKKTVKAKKGKKVKVQVRAYKKQGTNMLYSAWSKAKKVKVKK